MRSRSKVLIAVVLFLTIAGVPSTAFASSKTFNFDFGDGQYGYWKRVPANDDNDFNMPSEGTQYFLTDVTWCPNGGAVYYQARLMRHRTLRPDVSEEYHGDRNYCAIQYQNLNADWPSGRYHFDVHPDSDFDNPDGKGWVNTQWY